MNWCAAIATTAIFFVLRFGEKKYYRRVQSSRVHSTAQQSYLHTAAAACVQRTWLIFGSHKTGMYASNRSYHSQGERAPSVASSASFSLLCLGYLKGCEPSLHQHDQYQADKHPCEVDGFGEIGHRFDACVWIHLLRALSVVGLYVWFPRQDGEGGVLSRESENNEGAVGCVKCQPWQS